MRREARTPRRGRGLRAAARPTGDGVGRRPRGSFAARFFIGFYPGYSSGRPRHRFFPAAAAAAGPSGIADRSSRDFAGKFGRDRDGRGRPGFTYCRRPDSFRHCGRGGDHTGQPRWRAAHPPTLQEHFYA